MVGTAFNILLTSSVRIVPPNESDPEVRHVRLALVHRIGCVVYVPSTDLSIEPGCAENKNIPRNPDTFGPIRGEMHRILPVQTRNLSNRLSFDRSRPIPFRIRMISSSPVQNLQAISRKTKPIVQQYYGLPITCRFFRTKRVRRLSNRNVAVRFSLFSLVSQ